MEALLEVEARRVQILEERPAAARRAVTALFFVNRFLRSIRSLRYWGLPASGQDSRQSFRWSSARPDALLESLQALPWQPLQQWAISVSWLVRHS